jgi:hypothetical protein
MRGQGIHPATATPLLVSSSSSRAMFSLLPSRLRTCLLRWVGRVASAAASSEAGQT